MAFEKTLMGNPTGETPKKRKFERMGGIDVGGSMGDMYAKASEPKESPEEKAHRQNEARQYEERVMTQMRQKIGSGSSKRSEVMMGMPAVTPEQIAEWKKNQEEAEETERKIKEGFWGKIGRFFGRS